ncbi:hypothetical protein GF406_06990 [candidate division KSB1 bacterium]|nr:hypothetical protein [candidate division KSB1 bacterium]
MIKLLNTLFAGLVFIGFSLCVADEPDVAEWMHLSSLHHELPFAGVGAQVSTLILDVDNDGTNDFVIAGWDKPSMVWFKRTDTGWTKYVIDNGTEYIEAGGAFADIDGDGDLDIVQGGDWRTLKEVWWWENPAPDFDPETPWNRYKVKNSDEGGKQHHDQIFGDFDGDGRQELVFWNTSVGKLFLAEIPENPQKALVWDLHLIHQFDVEKGVNEGLAKGDIDLDGKLDIVGGGFWFKHIEGHSFEVLPVDPDYRSSRSAVGDLVKGGYPEVVLSSGDNTNSLNLYEFDGKNWKKSILIDKVINGHTLQVGDINGDSNLDIFCAEMAAWWIYQRNDAQAWVLYGNGKGDFVHTVLSRGICHHESKIGDLDGDGDMDILGKPFFINGAPLEIWLNMGNIEKSMAETTVRTIPPIFRAQKIDGPIQQWYGPFSEGSAVFDVDNDEVLDIVAGANWYKGPDYTKQPGFRDIKVEGEFVSNGCDHAYDVDGDGWTDVISNGWFGDQNIYWYKNPGKTGGKWKQELLIESKDTEFTLFEDVDGDGDPDIIPCHWYTEPLSDLCWYENNQGKFSKHLIQPEVERHGIGLGDINGDGRKDVITVKGWFEAPQDYQQGEWVWHSELEIPSQAASLAMVVYDVNNDGRNDVIYGEAHAYGLYWMEQKQNGEWQRHLIDNSWSQVHVLKLFDIDEDMQLELVTGKRLRGHAGKDPGSSDPLGIYYYDIDRENQTFTRNVLAYNAKIGTGMQINIVDINKDTDTDIVVSGKSGLYILESRKY